MTKMKLDGLSLADLKKLKSDAEKAIASYQNRMKSDARKAAEEAAKKFGFSLGDLVGKEKAKKAAAPAKYRNPADRSQTWSGRGRQPAWFKDGIAKGKSPDDFAI